MKRVFYILIFFSSAGAFAQRNPRLGVAFMNTGTAYPFAEFGKLATTVMHLGVEFIYSFNWRTKKAHDWYQEIKLGYFYHRFVQHGIPLYTDFGYRYKFSKKLQAQAAIGAGYMQSIPATAKLKLNADGEYKNNKGIGRAQAIMVFNVGIKYVLNPECKRPLHIFITYQQLLQTPFVKAYVPLLPYNSLMAGVSIPFHSFKK